MIAYLSLIVCVVGGLVWIIFGDSADARIARTAKLGMFAFIVGLAMWLFGK